MGIVATVLEKNSNVWSCADPQVTMIALGVLLAVCFVLSAIMWLLPIRVQIMLVSLVVTGSVVAKSLQPPAAKVPSTDPVEKSAVQAALGNYMHRVPDSLELELRHICETAIHQGQKYPRYANPNQKNR